MNVSAAILFASLISFISYLLIGGSQTSVISHL